MPLGYTIRPCDGTYGPFTVLGKVDRYSVFRKDKMFDEHLYSYLLENESATVKGIITEALSKYSKPGFGYSMVKPISIFATPLRRGKIDNGFRILERFVSNRLGSTAILNEQEALECIVELNSSPGFPYTAAGYQTRKSVLDNFNILDHTAEWWQSKRQGVWSGCLKHEIVKIEKIVTGRVRFFSCAPLYTQPKFLQFSAILNAKIVKASALFAFPTYIGVNMYSGGWQRMFSGFLNKDNFFSLDESNYDSTLHRELLDRCYALRNHLHVRPWSKEDVDRLVDELVDSYLITDTGSVIQKSQGNASGSPNTIFDNSLILLAFYFEAYARVYPHDTLADFMKYVSVLIMGDDNICGVSKERDKFNSQSVISVMLEWGLVPRIESEGTSLIGMEFVSRYVSRYYYCDVEYLVPIPKRVRVMAHLLMSTPGRDLLLSGIKLNSIMREIVFDDEMWYICKSIQNYYVSIRSAMFEFESDELTVDQFDSGVLTRDSLIKEWLGTETNGG